MPNNEQLLRIGGAIQLAILIASVQVPRMLDWRGELANLKPFLRQLFYVYGAFIILTIVGMGVISIAFADEIAASPGLGRAFAAFVFVFWGIRLIVQFFVFDARPILTTPIMRFAYRALSLAFILLVCAYGVVVFRIAS
ncbi:MAG: hypothetical protein H6819_03660 [Phycisphaerales bacterium]|nr:hypothetical protein [Phycisphaerales bacterium]MCB9856294.1 hypothetical protein [Phycisphaerales bacterium]MCB9863267.1 hypothetical protein [Phycisphaerales bacterium]